MDPEGDADERRRGGGRKSRFWRSPPDSPKPPPIRGVLLVLRPREGTPRVEVEVELGFEAGDESRAVARRRRRSRRRFSRRRGGRARANAFVAVPARASRRSRATIGSNLSDAIPVPARSRARRRGWGAAATSAVVIAIAIAREVEFQRIAPVSRTASSTVRRGDGGDVSSPSTPSTLIRRSKSASLASLASMSSRVVWWSFARDAGAPSRRSRSDAESSDRRGGGDEGEGFATPCFGSTSSSSSSPGGSIEPNGGEGGVARPASSADPREERGRLAAGSSTRGTFPVSRPRRRAGVGPRGRKPARPASIHRTRRRVERRRRDSDRARSVRSWFGSARERAAVWSRLRAGRGARRRGIAGGRARGRDPRVGGGRDGGDRNERHRGRARGGGRGGRAVPGVVPRGGRASVFGVLRRRPREPRGRRSFEPRRRRAGSPPRPGRRTCSRRGFRRRPVGRRGRATCRAPRFVVGPSRGWQRDVLFQKKLVAFERVRVTRIAVARADEGRRLPKSRTWHHAAYPRDRASYRAP